MEDRDNNTIICSVLFLDIVEYSKKSVSGQISLKDRFNTYLSEAICDVPVTDRIILDTGDGAAVNFLGDVESALKAALRLRTRFLNEDADAEPALLVRIGINLGPVRVVRDINGQPNIVGDGINVAQRVMAFADASQILVSRSYYEAVSRLSAEYSGMFHHQGVRTDKHVREHEIYAIGYPGDQTNKHQQVKSGVSVPFFSPIKTYLRTVSKVNLRILYFALIFVPLLLLVALITHLHEPDIAKPPQNIEIMVAASEVPAVQSQTKHSSRHTTNNKSTDVSSVENESVDSGTNITITCKESVHVFIDGISKGKLNASLLTFAVKPGKHKIFLTRENAPVIVEEVTVDLGRTAHLKPPACN